MLINCFENPVHKTLVNIISIGICNQNTKFILTWGSAKEMLVNQNCVSFALLLRQKHINGFENPVHKTPVNIISHWDLLPEYKMYSAYLCYLLSLPRQFSHA
jgi:hypothetical protein